MKGAASHAAAHRNGRRVTDRSRVGVVVHQLEAGEGHIAGVGDQVIVGHGLRRRQTGGGLV